MNFARLNLNPTSPSHTENHKNEQHHTRIEQEGIGLSRPAGLTVVGVLTLLASFSLAFLSLILFFLNFIAGGYSGGVGPSVTLRTVYVLFPPLFALFSFASAIALLVGVRYRYMWYAMVAFWAVLFVFMSWWGYAFVWRNVGEWFSNNRQVYTYQYEELAITLVPLAYSLGCLLYFQKANVREYFNVKNFSHQLRS
jgi:hypothetical protein